MHKTVWQITLLSAIICHCGNPVKPQVNIKLSPPLLSAASTYISFNFLVWVTVTSELELPPAGMATFSSSCGPGVIRQIGFQVRIRNPCVVSPLLMWCDLGSPGSHYCCIHQPPSLVVWCQPPSPSHISHTWFWVISWIPKLQLIVHEVVSSSSMETYFTLPIPHPA